MRTSLIIAGAATLLLVGWMASGALDEAPAPAPVAVAPQPPLVETRLSTPEVVERSLLVQGDAEAYRRIGVRAKTGGRVEAVLVEEGAEVSAGEPILRLALEARAERLAQAEARLDQRREDFEAAERLLARGVATEERLRGARAELETARAEVAAVEREIEDLTVRAPFPGVVNEIERRVGEVVQTGEAVAELIDNTPLRIEVRVPQQAVGRVETNVAAEIAYATGATETGRVCRVSAAADPATRTFQVEVRAPNPGGRTPSGVSAEVRLPTGAVEARFVTPAILSLDPEGRLGLKTVEAGDVVGFSPVEVVEAREDGVWVTGPEGAVEIVTRGQGFVRPGETVRVERGAEASPAPASPSRFAAEAPDAALCVDVAGGLAPGEDEVVSAAR